MILCRTEFVASLKHMQPVNHKFDIPEPYMTQPFWFHFYVGLPLKLQYQPFTHSLTLLKPPLSPYWASMSQRV